MAIVELEAADTYGEAEKGVLGGSGAAKQMPADGISMPDKNAMCNGERKLRSWTQSPN